MHPITNITSERRQKMLWAGIVFTSLLFGTGASCNQGTLDCGFPKPIGVDQGRCVPIANPCSIMTGPTAAWSPGDIFDLDPDVTGISVSPQPAPDAFGTLVRQVCATSDAPLVSSVPVNYLYTRGNDWGLGKVLITVASVPRVDASASPATIAPGKSSQLHPNLRGGIPPYHYMWTIGGSPRSLVSAASDPVVTPAATTQYELTVQDSGGDTTPPFEVTVISDLTGETFDFTFPLPDTAVTVQVEPVGAPAATAPVACFTRSSEYLIAASNSSPGLTQLMLDASCSKGPLPIQMYRWWFDWDGQYNLGSSNDGITTTATYPASAYPAYKTIRLEVTDAGGSKASATQPIVLLAGHLLPQNGVFPTVPPLACFIATSSGLTPGTAVALDGSCSDPGWALKPPSPPLARNNLTWEWVFDWPGPFAWNGSFDHMGRNVTLSYPVSAFPAAGTPPVTKTVFLKVTDEDGLSSTMAQDFQLLAASMPSGPPPYVPPVACFKVVGNAAFPGTPVTFDGSCTTGSIVLWEWYFNWNPGIPLAPDQSGPNLVMPTYTYNCANCFSATVHLVVTDNTGARSSATMTIPLL